MGTPLLLSSSCSSQSFQDHYNKELDPRSTYLHKWNTIKFDVRILNIWENIDNMKLFFHMTFSVTMESLIRHPQKRLYWGVQEVRVKFYTCISNSGPLLFGVYWKVSSLPLCHRSEEGEGLGYWFQPWLFRLVQWRRFEFFCGVFVMVSSISIPYFRWVVRVG